MGRYIVIEFDQNDDAAEFFEQFTKRNQFVRQFPLTGQASGAQRIVGIFVRPGNRCECWDRDTVNHRDPTKEKNAAGIARGAKFGWWVCSRCNKPRLGSHELVNQLPLSDTFEAPLVNGEWENQIDSLNITSIHHKNVKRKKKLRMRKGK